ncbi:hypothetical protein COCMIDRAFT_37230 [Bipolaris oryzae ATCC 44560]|uniref:Uncharacterized protein n=1 Tax=Bipolaris oryzae ATCC 44560 TaxID=930090 RepID=W6Z037_COCMI|nr:uncharacterized protein COCMIDRAFT_37230 [Bipolaris oryzae ATCC 44560]EUC44997.1 hypothetical protein COCMIDRAFT_37230 [Bipolaris oryzae ATCC 44560]
MPFRTPQPISKPPKCPPTPRPQPTHSQIPSPPHYNLTPAPPFFASLAARLAYTSEPRFLPNGELTRPDPMPGYIPVHQDDRLPVHPRPASVLSWKSGRRSERRREAKSDSMTTTTTTTTTTAEGRVEKKKKKQKEEAKVGGNLRQIDLVMRPKSEAQKRRHAGWHPCEHTAVAERQSEASTGNTSPSPCESGRLGRKRETYVRCTCCGREYQAKSPAELKTNTKLGICRDCGRRMGVEHGETEEMEL